MAAIETRTLASLVSDKEGEILPEWLELLKKAAGLQTGRISETELASQCRDFLRLLRDALERGGADASNAAYSQVRDFLGNVSRSRALQGFSAAETATFVFSLKQPLFNAMNRDKTMSPAALAQMTWGNHAAGRRGRPLQLRSVSEEPGRGDPAHRNREVDWPWRSRT